MSKTLKIPSGKHGTPADLASGIKDCVDAFTDYLKVKQVEETKRTDILARRDIAITAIQSQKEIILTFIEKTYSERSVVIQKNLEILDVAIERGDTNTINYALSTIVNIIQINPLEQIKKVTEALSSQDSILKLE
jgi:hypothetical protein